MYEVKRFSSRSFNYLFNTDSGDTILWGKTINDDPIYAPSPVLVDFEITTICGGIGSEGPCKHCYKSNTKTGKYIDFNKAKIIIDRLPQSVTQIAFGVDAKCNSNPYWFDIFSYARSKGFVPNVTVADVDNNTVAKLADICGAVAVSRYANKEYCYNSIHKLCTQQKLLTTHLRQVNMHMLASEETYPQMLETLDDIKHDDRLKDLNAIVFLSLKKKGRGVAYNQLSIDKFKHVVDTCIKEKIPFGFDSCSTNKFLSISDGHYKMFSEPCESTLQSAYINVNGDYFPCSFVEGEGDWEEGLSLFKYSVGEVWKHPKTKKFRRELMKCNRSCPMFII